MKIHETFVAKFARPCIDRLSKHSGTLWMCRAKDRESTTEIPFLCDSLCMSLDHYGSMYVSF